VRFFAFDSMRLENAHMLINRTSACNNWPPMSNSAIRRIVPAATDGDVACEVHCVCVCVCVCGVSIGSREAFNVIASVTKTDIKRGADSVFRTITILQTLPASPTDDAGTCSAIDM